MINKVDAFMSLRPGAEFLTKNGVVTWLSEDQTQPTDAEVAAEITRLEGLRIWNELRTKRNQLLAETDYFANTDVTMPDAMRTYRQALRDLPANTSDPANPVWPSKPDV